jgi:hypothetical protein
LGLTDVNAVEQCLSTRIPSLFTRAGIVKDELKNKTIKTPIYIMSRNIPELETLPKQVADFIDSISHGYGGDCYIQRACVQLYRWLATPTDTPSLPVEPDAFVEWLDIEIDYNDRMAPFGPQKPSVFEARARILQEAKFKYLHFHAKKPDSKTLAVEEVPCDQVIEDAVFWNRRCVGLTNELSSLREQLAEARNDVSVYQQWHKEAKEQLEFEKQLVKRQEETIRKLTEQIKAQP